MSLTAALGLAACGNSTSTSGPVNGGTLVYSLDADAQSLNPFEIGDVPSARAIQFMFPVLYQPDKNMNMVPDLADGLPTISSDHLTWTVKIRTDAKWSDGSAITADDVIKSSQIQADPTLDTDQTFDWSPVADPKKDITKVDDHTIKYVLSSPFAPFLAVNLNYQIAPAKVYGSIDPTKMRTDPSNDHPTVTGGPFLYDKRIPGQEIDLKANPNYYAGRPHFDRIVEKIITDTTAAANSLKSGDVQADPEINGAAIDAVKGVAGINTYIYPDLAYYDVRFNDRPGFLFSDLAVRQAWEYVQDHDGMIKAATDGHGTPMTGDIPPASWAFDANAAPPYPKQDIAKAQQMLTAAGWVKGSDGILAKNGKKFVADFCVRADKPQRVKAVTIMADAASKVGMQLTPKPIDFKVFYKALAKGGCGMQTGEFQLGLAGWGLALDPDDYSIFSSKFIRPEVNPSGQNYTGFSNAKLDADIQKAREDVKGTLAETQAARKKDYAAVQKDLRSNSVVYFLWADNVGQGFVDKVQGVVAGGPNGQDMNYADQSRNIQVFGTWYFKGGK
jgi:peptide/nickel transport system substrate-binding protein